MNPNTNEPDSIPETQTNPITPSVEQPQVFQPAAVQPQTEAAPMPDTTGQSIAPVTDPIPDAPSVPGPTVIPSEQALSASQPVALPPRQAEVPAPFTPQVLPPQMSANSPAAGPVVSPLQAGQPQQAPVAPGTFGMPNLPAEPKKRPIKKIALIAAPVILLFAIGGGVIASGIFDQQKTAEKVSKAFVKALNKGDVDGMYANSTMADNITATEKEQIKDINKYMTIEETVTDTLVSSEGGGRAMTLYPGSIALFGKQDVNVAIFMGKIDGKWKVTYLDFREKDKQFEADLNKYNTVMFQRDGFKNASSSSANTESSE